MEPEPNAAAADGAAARGRPSTCTPDKVHAVCAFIRLTGFSDTAAAAMAGVTRSTLARWKKEDDEVERLLDEARCQYQAPRLEKIDRTRMKDGQHDWRAQAWLVKFANPEVYGAPSRRRKLRDVELEPEAALTPQEQQAKDEAEARAQIDQAVKDWETFGPSTVITPAMLALLQQRRAIALRKMQADEQAAAQGSAPVQAGATDEAADTDAPSSGEATAKSVTIRPEIHSLYRDPGAWVRPGTSGAPSPALGARRSTAATAG
jgi:hypothetical protein